MYVILIFVSSAKFLQIFDCRSRSMSIEAWRVAAEEEHYDSSPSPVSCYDTASESGPYGNEILPGELLHYICLIFFCFLEDVHRKTFAIFQRNKLIT